jgi:hypothetical protein
MPLIIRPPTHVIIYSSKPLSLVWVHSGRVSAQQTVTSADIHLWDVVQ